MQSVSESGADAGAAADDDGCEVALSSVVMVTVSLRNPTLLDFT